MGIQLIIPGRPRNADYLQSVSSNAVVDFIFVTMAAASVGALANDLPSSTNWHFAAPRAHGTAEIMLLATNINVPIFGNARAGSRAGAAAVPAWRDGVLVMSLSSLADRWACAPPSNKSSGGR